MCEISCRRQHAIVVISSLLDLYHVCYGNQCQSQTKINCIKNYSMFYEKWTIRVCWDGQDGARWDNHSLCPEMLILVEVNKLHCRCMFMGYKLYLPFLSHNFYKLQLLSFYLKSVIFIYISIPSQPTQYWGNLWQLTFFAEKCLTQSHLHFSVCSFAIP